MGDSTAKLILDGQEHFLPIISGSDGSRALDIDDLYEKTGIKTYDPHLTNTSYVRSAISWTNQATGALVYRGYDIGELVEHSSFVETSYLLTYGELPGETQLKKYSQDLSTHSMIHEDMRNIFDAFPANAHPLAILATMVTVLSSYYPQTYEENIAKGIDIGTGLLSKVRTLAAWSYRKSVGLPLIYPVDALPYWRNFLNMMFAFPDDPYLFPPEDERILNQLAILYSDNGQSVATSSVRLIGSTKANLFACIVSGMSAMWGSREHGANIPPMLMLIDMVNQHISPDKYFEKFIKGHEPLRSNGISQMANRVKNSRSLISQHLFHEYRKNHPNANSDPYIQMALEVEEFVTGHPYFLELGLYPNLDFYSALLFHLIGIPMTMNNVIRVIGKLSGWLAHWHEQRDLSGLAYHPAQIYNGVKERRYIPIAERK